MIPQTATKTISKVAVYFFFTAALIALNYFTPRTNFVQLIILYSFLFVAYLHIIFYWKDDKHIKEAKFVSVALRFLLLFSIPNLSDDFYRYIWDGSLMHHGINPFTYTPQQLLNDPSLHQAAVKISDGNIYEHLNSEQYYSVYPPVGQFFFFITAKICHLTKGGLLLNIFILKFFILLSEIGTIYFLSKILNHLNFSSKNILLYALNPLIILELTGNIHFEAVTIFFLAASIYFLLKHRYFLSAVLFGLSVATKILPLILLPFLLKYIGFRKTIVYSSITAIVFIISFIPFYNAGLIRHFSTSLQLYFVSFEFNGSIYNFSKWLSGFNYSSKLMIQKVLPVIACFLILLTSFFYKKERLFQFFLFAFFIYFLFSTTVHPWYITPLILFTVITNYKFPIVWSGLIYLTYITYAGNGFKENYFIITIEYLILFAFMISELFIRKINKKPVPSY